MPADYRAYAHKIFHEYEGFRSKAFPARRFLPEEFHKEIDRLAGDVLTVRPVGVSFEGRPLRLISAGTGPVRVLLWSQMHGDESTATMAIADILSYLGSHRGEREVQLLLNNLTISLLPMLNPDGAARFQRRTAQGIDMNRDAVALVTPEAKTLIDIHKELAPSFGFNLHDQELSTVGFSKDLSMIALLAPAFDHHRSNNTVRARATRLAAAFAHTMHEFIPAHLSRYDDSFEPRAFGDTIQRLGTSTILVESGHAFNDPEKASIRKLNTVGILAALFTIAAGRIDTVDPAAYEQLSFNGKRAYDIILRNVTVAYKNSSLATMDLAVSYQVDTHSEPPPLLVDMGDLHTFVGLREYEVRGVTVRNDNLVLGKAFDWESLVR